MEWNFLKVGKKREINGKYSGGAMSLRKPDNGKVSGEIRKYWRRAFILH
jgi:hypothetical protein